MVSPKHGPCHLEMHLRKDTARLQAAQISILLKAVHCLVLQGKIHLPEGMCPRVLTLIDILNLFLKTLVTVYLSV